MYIYIYIYTYIYKYIYIYVSQFDTQDIQNLNKNSSLARDVYGVNYLPGFVGLNNLKNTDYVNVILHALSHVTPIRDYFLNSKNYENSKSVLVHKFGEVIRKLWSRFNFKSIVSPQDLLQVFIYMNLLVCIYTCIYTYICLCIYLHIYTYIDIYTYIYIGNFCS
jgi:hypothetical protein